MSQKRKTKSAVVGKGVAEAKAGQRRESRPILEVITNPSNPSSPERQAAPRPREDSIRPLPMVDQIAQALTDEIARGVYKSDERIREQELAQRFQVSRGPIREALRVLEADGLVQILPWRGAVVATRSAREMNENAEVRATLFELAARLAASNASLEQIARIKQEAGKLKTLTDDPERIMDYKEQSARTGRLVSDASGNSQLSALLASLARRTLRHYSYLGLSTPERRRRSSELWAKLAAAIAARNADRAASAARKLVEESQQHAMAMLREMEAHGEEASAASADAAVNTAPVSLGKRR